MTRLYLAATLLLVCLLTGGCSGGGGGTPGGGSTQEDTGRIKVTVVQADSPTVGIRGASVALRTASGAALAEGTTAAGGVFTFQNVSVGSQTIMVDTVGEAEYGEQTIRGVPVTKNTLTEVTVAVLRVDTPAPSVLDLTPGTAQVEVLGSADFTSAVRGSSGALAVTPSFWVTGGIGSARYDAASKRLIFSATRQGSGTLQVVCGTLTAQSAITVVAAGAPDVSSFQVAPMTLPATGGTITITVAAIDGDGVREAKAEIFKPDATSTTVALPRVNGTDGTYQATTTLPANNNSYDGTGLQPSQIYQIRYMVTDYSGQTATTPTDEFVTVTVDGLRQPPPPPPSE